MVDKKPDISIQNLVISADIHAKLPLDVLAMNLENAEYEPESFPGLVYRIKEPKASTLVFTSGRIICSGTKDIDVARKAIKKTIEDFKKLGIKVNGEPEMEIVNMVTSVDIHLKLDLNTIVFKLGECEYEPEQFPGLVYRMEETNVVFLIFNSGRLVCTGARNMETVEKSVELLKKKLYDIGAVRGSN